MFYNPQNNVYPDQSWPYETVPSESEQLWALLMVEEKSLHIDFEGGKTSFLGLEPG